MLVQRTESWGAAKTAGFRVFALFMIAYMLPLEPLTNLVIPAIGHTVLGIEGEIPLEMTGSGDTMAEYIRLLLHATVAIVGGAVWTIARPPRMRYVRALHWLTFAIRIALATAMLSYGIAKVLDGQFVEPGAGRMITAYGDSSPMGLLWTFMGHSKAYCVFTGLAEIVGGLLLFSRRTQTLGALVVIGVMSNVVMLNFCYDVPVKLFSMRLLAMAIFVAALDWQRLRALFVAHHTIEARPLPQLFASPRRHFIGRIVKALYVALLLLSPAIAYLFGMGRPPHASSAELEGLYDVQTHVRDGIELPPLLTDPDRWRYLAIDQWGRAVVHGMDGTRTRFGAELDGDTLTLQSAPGPDAPDPAVELAFTLDRSTGDALILHATDDPATTIHLVRRDPDTFLLRNRGFHWVQEFPFNR